MTQPYVILATASYDHTIKLWEAKSGRCYQTIQYPEYVMSYDSHTNNVMPIGFQCDGKWMYSGLEDGTVKIWDLRSANNNVVVVRGLPGANENTKVVLLLSLLFYILIRLS